MKLMSKTAANIWYLASEDFLRHTALIKPEAVYVYTDSEGRRVPPMPWPKTVEKKGITDGINDWPWKLKVAP